MIVTRKISELKKIIEKEKNENKKIGFVPTMGALHPGHLSLIKCSSYDNEVTIVSIFVNPTQFNNKEDLKKYPRNEIMDIEILMDTKCSVVFIPEIEEMYPEKDIRVFDFKGLDKVMEGKYREGHFNGVAQIVSKLFEIVRPDIAYFGKKDFQQVAIIHYLNEHYLKNLNIEIKACDIIRENDGLAMSSRNALLSKEERMAASQISKIMNQYLNLYKEFSVLQLKEKIIKNINEIPELQTEYFEIVNNTTLKSVNQITTGQTTACIAVYAGNIRLIDNFSF